MNYKIPAAVLAAIIAALGVNEGRKYIAYKDRLANGLLTVCDGITGPDVIAGKVYSDAECDALVVGRVVKYDAQIMACLRQPLPDHVRISFNDAAFNLGPSRFCSSSIAKRWNAGDHAGSCAAILLYRYAGGLDCFLPANAKRCGGIKKRREWEYATCMGTP